MPTPSLIEEALGHPAKIRVLRVLHKPGSGYMSLNQLAKITSLNPMTLSRALKSLQELGLASYVRAGASQLWRLTEGYAATTLGPILDAMNEAPSLIDHLKEVIRSSSIPPFIDKIILYGSVARGESQAGSDIDLFVFRSERSKKTESSYYDDDKISLDGLIERISKAFWMNPSFLVKTPAEFKKMTPEFRKNIKEGIVLYEKDPDKRSA